MGTYGRRVLIAVKSVREVTWLVDVALSLIEPGTEVDVLHAGERDPDAYRAGEEAVHEALDQLSVHGVAGLPHVQPSDRPVEQIVGLAAELGTHIIILGAGGAHTMGIGSTAREVVARAPQPVILVPMSALLPSLRLARVLAAVGSEDDIEPVLESVKLLGVRQVVIAHVARAVAIHALAAHAFAEIPETSKAVVQHSVRAMRGAGYSATTAEPRDGLSLGDAIEEAAERSGASMIIVASRRPSPLGAAIKGSAAYAIVAHAKRPVLFAAPTMLPSTATA